MDKENMVYCGFGVYFDPATCSRYEKVNDKLVQIDADLSEIEMSYVDQAMKKKHKEKGDPR